MLVDALALTDVGGVEVHGPPFGELARRIGRDVITLRRVVIDPRYAQSLRVVGVGTHRLLYFAGLDDDAARQRVFVFQHQRQARVVLVGRVELRISCLIGVVRNLEPLRVEGPEPRPLDRTGVLCDQRIGAVLGECIGDVGVGEQTEIILRDAVPFAFGAGVLAAHSRHQAPASEIGRRDAVRRGDVLRVVDRETLVVVARPCVVFQVFVQRVVVHVVVGVLGSGPQRPAGRELLVEGQRGGGHVVDRDRIVAVGRVCGGRGGRSGYAAEVVVLGVRGAAVVVGQHLERRTQRVDLPDVVERQRVVVARREIVIAAVGAGHTLCGREVRVGVVGTFFAVAPVFELRADALAGIDLVHRTEARAEIPVAFEFFGVGFETVAARRVAGVFVRFEFVGFEVEPRQPVEVEPSRMVVDARTGIDRPHPAAQPRIDRQRPLHAVFAAFAERYPDDAARRIRIVVRAGRGHDLDFLDVVGAQRTQVGQQLRRFHAQLAVVDVHLRTALAVDRDLLVVHPYARSALQQFDAILADRRRGVGHIDDKAVGLAADQLRLDHHALDLRRGAFQHDVAQIVVRIDAHLPQDGIETQILDREGVFARRDLQLETSGVVGRHAGHLLAAPEQYHRRILHGLSLRVHDAASGRIHAGRYCVRRSHCEQQDKEDKFFHNILRLIVICVAF